MRGRMDYRVSREAHELYPVFQFMTDNPVIPGEGESTSSSLLNRSMQEDPVAWARLVSLYGPLVYCWCRKWGMQPADAENIGQETFLKVVRKIKSFNAAQAGASFRGWIYRIAHRSLVDYVRKQKAEMSGVGGSDGQTRLLQVESEYPRDDGSESTCTSEETSLLYSKAIELIRSEFSDRDWQAFFRVVVDGQDPCDIAEELDVSTNVVYLAKSRILRRLKQEFVGLLPDFSR